MRKIIRVGLAAALGGLMANVSGIANAADSPPAMPVKAPILQAAPDWRGWYVGGHIGAGWGNSTGSFADPGNTAQFNCAPCFAPGFVSPNVDRRDAGFLGGIHFGYNWQIAPTWLVGVEGDFTWTGISPSSNAGLTGIALGGAPFCGARHQP